MFSQLFGSYLLNNGLIKPDQLKKSIEMQKNLRLKLGVIAISMGYMNANQVKEIHNLQTKFDKKFGEIAIELGYLTKEQLDGLLKTQKQGYLLLAQAMIENNFITLDQLENAINDYKKHYGLTDEQYDAIQNEDIDEIVNMFFNFQKCEIKDIYRDYVTLFLKNVIRFIDDDIRIEINEDESEYNEYWVIFQAIEGKYNIYTSIAAEANVFLNIASRYANEELTQIDDMAKDSAAEFLNLVNGIFIMNMSNRGVELEIKPPTLRKDNSLSKLHTAFVLTVYLTSGKFYIILTE